jgi:CheY-like chemotaxis protein
VILLKSHPNWKGVQWPRRDPNLHAVHSLDEVVDLAGRGGVERVVIEEKMAGSDFLRILSRLPAGLEVVWICGALEAYVSRGAPRALYAISSADVERHALQNADLAGERLRVLIAEDERKTREFLVSVVDALGCQTLVSAAGLEAVKLVQEHRPHVLLIDGLMPEMHGFEVARFVRALDPAYRPRIAIITAIYKDARYQTEARLKFGVDHYLVKPVTRDQVVNAVFGG